MSVDLGQALDGHWRPPEEMTVRDRRLVAVARSLLYARRPATFWLVMASGEAIREHPRGLGLDLLTEHLSEVDAPSDAPPEHVVAEMASRYRTVGVGEMDARHGARVKRAPRVDLDHALDFLRPEQAAAFLEIEPGEYPAIAPASSNPLPESPPWWIREGTGR